MIKKVFEYILVEYWYLTTESGHNIGYYIGQGDK